MRVRITKDSLDLQAIIDKCEVCFMGMVDQEGLPYVLPFNFGYENGIFYLHSAKTGRKMEILKNNPNVCLAFSTDHRLFKRHETMACSYGYDYKSVIASGRIEFIEDFEAKVLALNIIMRKYTGRDFAYNSPAVNNVAVYRVTPSLIQGKVSGY